MNPLVHLMTVYQEPEADKMGNMETIGFDLSHEAALELVSSDRLPAMLDQARLALDVMTNKGSFDNFAAPIVLAGNLRLADAGYVDHIHSSEKFLRDFYAAIQKQEDKKKAFQVAYTMLSIVGENDESWKIRPMSKGLEDFCIKAIEEGLKEIPENQLRSPRGELWQVSGLLAKKNEEQNSLTDVMAERIETILGKFEPKKEGAEAPSIE